MTTLATSAQSPEAPALERALSDALARAGREAEIIGVALAAPAVPAEALIAEHDDDALVFAPPVGQSAQGAAAANKTVGFECAGLGVCASITAAGCERFALVQQRAAALFTRLYCTALDVPVPEARLFGGFAFQAGRAETELWRAFGEARFVLPRLLYTRSGGTATLSLFARRDELEQPMVRRALAFEGERVLAALAAAGAEPTNAHVRAALRSSPELGSEGGADWSRAVTAIRDEIAAGRLEKVVLARRVELDLQRAADPAQVLARLRVQAAECTRFLLTTSGHTFLGAAPERLVKKQGASFETEAVAGSMKVEEPLLPARLLESEKDLAEHAMVVRGIADALGPVAGELEYPRRPELHRLRHVVHLRTPIRGRLIGSDHVLSLVERLHPTPAVGGLPSSEALEWIAAHEPDERGWYAGPFGWFDAAGDGEFVVALRSGLLAAGRAHLYVGAGIVSASSPLEEFAETQWKLAALAGALGVGS